jgi:hypothetical protein
MYFNTPKPYDVMQLLLCSILATKPDVLQGFTDSESLQPQLHIGAFSSQDS